MPSVTAASIALRVSTSQTASWNDAATSSTGTGSPARSRASTQRATAVFSPENEKSKRCRSRSRRDVSPRGKSMDTDEPDRAARDGDSVYVDFPRGLTSRKDLERHRFDFSFSGLKTAVARWVEARERSGEPVPVNDVAASFQEAVCDVLTRKAIDAAVTEGIDDILIGGGVAANSRLRAMAEERAAAKGIRVRVPRPGLCTDNGAMVAALGSEMVRRGRTPSALDLPADSSLPVTEVLV